MQLVFGKKSCRAHAEHCGNAFPPFLVVDVVGRPSQAKGLSSFFFYFDGRTDGRGSLFSMALLLLQRYCHCLCCNVSKLVCVRARAPGLHRGPSGWFGHGGLVRILLAEGFCCPHNLYYILYFLWFSLHFHSHYCHSYCHRASEVRAKAELGLSWYLAALTEDVIDTVQAPCLLALHISDWTVLPRFSTFLWFRAPNLELESSSVFNEAEKKNKKIERKKITFCRTIFWIHALLPSALKGNKCVQQWRKEEKRKRERERVDKNEEPWEGKKAESKKTNNGMNFCTHTRSTVSSTYCTRKHLDAAAPPSRRCRVSVCFSSLRGKSLNRISNFDPKLSDVRCRICPPTPGKWLGLATTGDTRLASREREGWNGRFEFFWIPFFLLIKNFK